MITRMAYFHRCVMALAVLTFLPHYSGAETNARDGMRHGSDETYSWSDEEYHSIYVREKNEKTKPVHASYEDYLHLRNRYNQNSSPAPDPLEKKSPPSVKPAIQTNKFSRLKNYRVQDNDTLYSIARKFNVPIQVIMDINKLKNRNRIFKGTVLKIPETGDIEKKTTPEKEKSPKKPNHDKSPRFTWPIKTIDSVKRDGSDGVKSIGLIIKSKPGSPVLSAAGGIVKKIGYMRGFGNYVVLVHQNRYATVYANLDEIFVNLGQKIDSGRPIGKIQSVIPSLHFQIDYGGKPQNPLNFLPKRG